MKFLSKMVKNEAAFSQRTDKQSIPHCMAKKKQRQKQNMNALFSR